MKRIAGVQCMWHMSSLHLASLCCALLFCFLLAWQAMSPDHLALLLPPGAGMTASVSCSCHVAELLCCFACRCSRLCLLRGDGA